MSSYQGTHPSTEHFSVTDSIGIPHPYCLTPRHVAVASDHFCGRLGKDAIIDAEKRGVKCGMRGCTLAYGVHA